MSKSKQVFWLTGKGIMIFCVIAFASYLLFVEHANHLVGWLPFLIILLCPLMHLFMHHGHGNHHESGSQDDSHNDTSEKSDDYQRGYEAAIQADEKDHLPSKRVKKHEHE